MRIIDSGKTEAVAHPVLILSLKRKKCHGAYSTLCEIRRLQSKCLAGSRLAGPLLLSIRVDILTPHITLCILSTLRWILEDLLILRDNTSTRTGQRHNK